METPFPFADWRAVLDAPRSAFFGGHTADAVHDRTIAGVLSPHCEALFTQSNARVLLGQAASGALRFVAIPTQVYPAPTGEGELGLGPGMYHHFDVAMYAGDLSYRIAVEGAEAVYDFAGDEGDGQTAYADHFLPLTRTRCGNIEATIFSLAPVAADAASAPLAPAPLPGPAGAIYALRLRNAGSAPLSGRIILQAGDLLVGHYEEAASELRSLKRPSVDLRQGTLILTRPDGAVGVHLHGGHWNRLEAPFQAECPFSLAPGEETVVETHLGLGRAYAEVMPTIYALHLRSALEWLNLTARFWRSRLGQLDVEANGAPDEARMSRDIYIRCLLDNFNCLQTDAEGRLVAHWQGAPSHGYGTVWGIDVEPTALSVLPICPELVRRALEFFMTRSRAPKGTADHSVPILVAPVIIARKWLQATHDAAYLREHPEVLAALQGIMDDLLALSVPEETLFPSRYSSDGPVGRRYDYGTNAKVSYACDSFAYLLVHAGHAEEAERYRRLAQAIRAAIGRRMIICGPFGPQISGGTNLGEPAGTFYLPEGVPYYDGEDTSSMLAPLYGVCELTDEPWANYHRFARSLWCPNYDPEFDTLRWSPGEMGVVDGTAFFSRLGGSLTRAEMREAFAALAQVGVDQVTGSVFWWPHGLEFRRGLTRCSQGQGAWAWQYLEQWLGLAADAPSRTLTVAPRGLLSRVGWEGCTLGTPRFSVHWAEQQAVTTLRVRNHNQDPWTLRAGFRQAGCGAEGSLLWQTCTVQPQEEVTLTHQGVAAPATESMDRQALCQREIRAFGDAQGVLLRRYGPALLWGHWDPRLWWDMRAMPLAVRLVVGNGTTMDWRDVTVTLRYPEGWAAQGRAPRHWPRPDRLERQCAQVSLGSLAMMQRTVAAFWVQGPYTFDLGRAWDASAAIFHATSQPGEGLTLPTEEVGAVQEVAFLAELRAVASDGQEVYRRTVIPVRIVPAVR